MNDTEKLLRNEMELGNQARDVVSNDAFKRAFDTIEQDILKQLRRIHSADMPNIQVAKISLDLLAMIRSRLEHMIQTGDMASETFRQEQEAKERPQWRNRWREYFKDKESA